MVPNKIREMKGMDSVQAVIVQICNGMRTDSWPPALVRFRACPASGSLQSHSGLPRQTLVMRRRSQGILRPRSKPRSALLGGLRRQALHKPPHKRCDGGNSTPSGNGLRPTQGLLEGQGMARIPTPKTHTGLRKTACFRTSEDRYIPDARGPGCV